MGGLEARGRDAVEFVVTQHRSCSLVPILLLHKAQINDAKSVCGAYSNDQLGFVCVNQFKSHRIGWIAFESITGKWSKSKGL